MWQTIRPLRRVVVAFPAVGLAALLVLVFDPQKHDGPLFAFLAAVLWTAWFGGLGGAVLAIGLSILAVGTLVPQQRILIVSALRDVFELGMFSLLTLVVAALGKTRRRVEEGEKRYQLLFENSLGLVCVHDLEGNLLSVSPAVAQALGYRPDETKGKNVRDFLAPSVRPMFGEYLERIRRNPIDSGLMRMLARGGSERIWLYRNVRYQEGGRAPCVLGHAQDVTELHEAQRKLRAVNQELETRVALRAASLARTNEQLRSEIGERRRQKEVLQTIFDHIPVMVGFCDADGRPRMANRELERILGWSLKEMADRDILAECYPDPASRLQVVNHLRSPHGGWKDFPTRVRGGRIVDVCWASASLSDGTHIAIGQDITETKRLEERLRQAQKMEAIGRLAGGVAHDFNNILTIIGGFSEVVLDSLGSGHPLKGDLEEIKKATDRAAALVEQLLAFGRRQMLQPEVLDLNTALHKLDKMLRRLIGENIILETVPAAGLRRVKVDRAQFEQVMLNVVANARDAMPQGGRLRIEVANVDLDSEYSRTHLDVTPGSYVMLEVSDTGPGMDPKTRERIFEPFFTTKGMGRGTGLGLSTVYGMVAQSGGHVAVESELGRGTTFRIFLPAAADSPGTPG